MGRKDAETLTDAERATLDLWTAQPMTFHEGHGEFITYPRFTECRKPPYTVAMRDALAAAGSNPMHPLDPGDRWVYVVLAGKQRQVLRSHVLTKKEYDDVRARERAALGTLRAKQQRDVGAGGADRDGDPPGLAGADGRGPGAG